jgi:predicted molibdopterin-dependent oxidoreductase YjgC
VAGLAATLGSGAMTNSIADIPQADVLLVIGSNTTEAHPVIALQMKKAVRKHGAKLILIDPRRIELAQFAALHLRQHPGSDVALINAMAHVILAEGLENRAFIAERTEGIAAFEEAVRDWTPERAAEICGVPGGEIAEAARLYAQAPAAAIFWAMGITQHTHGTDNVKALSNLALLCGQIGRPGTGLNPLRGQNNVQGACDMGGLPNVYPGYQPVTSEDVRRRFADGWNVPFDRLSPRVGLTVTEVMDGALEGRVRALFVLGENPMLSDPNLHHVEEALRRIDFLAVQDLFLNETAAMADVVLPGAGFAEKSGTYTNTERRVQLVRPAFAPPSEARQDWEILAELAHRLGAPWSYAGPSEIFDEMARLTASYSGMSHARLEKASLQWPCPAPDHPGTPILHTQKFTRGLGLFAPVSYIPPAEIPDDEFPLILSTGRVLFHWHGGTLSRRSPGLDSLAPVSEVEIHPDDAADFGITDGRRVRVRSRRGEVVARARITRRRRGDDLRPSTCRGGRKPADHRRRRSGRQDPGIQGRCGQCGARGGTCGGLGAWRRGATEAIPCPGMARGAGPMTDPEIRARKNGPT